MDFNNKPSDLNKKDNDSAPERVEQGDTTGNVRPVALAVKPSLGSRVKRFFNNLVLLVLFFIMVGVASWFYWQNYQAQASLRQKDAVIANLNAAVAAGSNNDPKTDSAPVRIDLTAEEAVRSASSTFVCTIKDFGCDKNLFEVQKIQAPENKAGEGLVRKGYALVKVTSSSKNNINLYLVSDGSFNRWVVIHHGKDIPPREVIERFDIPAFLITDSTN